MNKWHTLKDKTPSHNGFQCPIWVKANHNQEQFPEWGMWYQDAWYVGGQQIEKMGWEFVAWFDLPKYEAK